MHQTKKGNQWYFGMKAHFGVDSRSKLIHTLRSEWRTNPGVSPGPPSPSHGCPHRPGNVSRNPAVK
jgi:hypothetical protein